MNLDQFHKDHKELMGMATEILGLLNEQAVIDNAEKISTLLGSISGKLKIHLALEDKQLYPELMNSSNPEVQTKAASFQNEMGGLKEAFTQYASAWLSPMKIKNDPNTFINQTKEVFGAVANRVEREEKELYPMAEAA